MDNKRKEYESEYRKNVRNKLSQHQQMMERIDTLEREVAELKQRVAELEGKVADQDNTIAEQDQTLLEWGDRLVKAENLVND